MTPARGEPWIGSTAMSHGLSVAADFCDRIAVMYSGHIVETGERAPLASPGAAGGHRCGNGSSRERAAPHSDGTSGARVDRSQTSRSRDNRRTLCRNRCIAGTRQCIRRRRHRNVVRETKVPSQLDAIVAFIRSLGFAAARICLEAGSLSQWLDAGLTAAGLRASRVCVPCLSKFTLARVSCRISGRTAVTTGSDRLIRDPVEGNLFRDSLMV